MRPRLAQGHVQSRTKECSLRFVSASVCWHVPSRHPQPVVVLVVLCGRLTQERAYHSAFVPSVQCNVVGCVCRDSVYS